MLGGTLLASHAGSVRLPTLLAAVLPCPCVPSLLPHLPTLIALPLCSDGDEQQRVLVRYYYAGTLLSVLIGPVSARTAPVAVAPMSICCPFMGAALVVWSAVAPVSICCPFMGAALLFGPPLLLCPCASLFCQVKVMDGVRPGSVAWSKELYSSIWYRVTLS